MRLLFLGDIVGRRGREAIEEGLSGLIEMHGLDFVVANAENAAGGFGVTEPIYQRLRTMGVDVLSGGNHSWSRREALTFIERCPHLLRPLNFPPESPGRGEAFFQARNGARVLVINLLGRLFMGAVRDPFSAVEQAVAASPLGIGADAIIVDFHAEATSEKQAMAHFLDGSVSLVVGTHTHVPTADHRILPNGTAAMTDVGMCGDYDSIIGMEKGEPLCRFLSDSRTRSLVPARGEATVSGVAVDIDDRTGLAKHVAPLRLGGVLEETIPAFW